MQNSEMKKEILGQHREISAKELENYLNGKLSASEARAVEMKMHSNDFSSDATDGFETYGKSIAISEIGKPWKVTNYSWIAWTILSAVAVVIIGMWALQPSIIDPIKTSTSSIETPTKTEIKSKTITYPKTETNTGLKEPANTGPSEPISDKNEKTSESTEPKYTGDIKGIPVLFSGEIEREIFNIQPLETKAGQIQIDSETKELKTQSARLRHYRNYKLVDQGIGINESLLQPIINGSPAFMETIVVNPKYPAWMPADSVYKASLDEAIDWIIDEDYKQAKMRLTRLVENTTEDLTASFYLGYTLFLKNEFENALVYLNRAQAHLLQTYDQDARFIEIKCLLELGRLEEAKSEAIYLKESKSLYGERAMELVD